MKRQSQSRRFTFVCIAALLALAGCAVLTVDVDVYKGPLANHEDVQVQQAAVMAIGAKPLLIQLRDSLECDHRKSELDEAFGPAFGVPPRSLASLRSNDWYYAGYIKPQPKGTGLQDAQALRVNEILGLYEDQGPQEYSALISAAKEAYDQFLFHLSALRTNSPEAKAVAKDLRHLARKKSGTGNTNLLAAYKALYPNKPGEQRQISNVINANNILSSTNPPIREHLEKKSLDKSITPESAIKYWSLLKNEDFLILEAQAMGLETNQTKAFVTQTKNIASHYVAANEELKRTLNLNLKLYELLQLTASDCNAGKDALGILKQMILDLVDHQKANSAQVTNLSTGKTTNSWAAQNFSTAKPEYLPATHQLLELNNSQANLSGITKDVQDRELWERSSDEQIKYIELEGLLGGGFERGRLALGLESLIENYLSKDYKLPANASEEQKAEAAREKERLLDGLVQFAQKVLFLANNERLLRLKTNPLGPLVNIQSKIVKFSYYDASAFSHRESYGLILQAVGNSILVQVDELRQQATYKTRMSTNGLAEAIALRNAFSSSPAKVYDDLIADLQGQTKKLPYDQAAHNSATQAMTTEIATAKNEISQKITNSNDLNTLEILIKKQIQTNTTWLGNLEFANYFITTNVVILQEPSDKVSGTDFVIRIAECLTNQIAAPSNSLASNSNVTTFSLVISNAASTITNEDTPKALLLQISQGLTNLIADTKIKSSSLEENSRQTNAAMAECKKQIAQLQEKTNSLAADLKKENENFAFATKYKDALDAITELRSEILCSQTTNCCRDAKDLFESLTKALTKKRDCTDCGGTKEKWTNTLNVVKSRPSPPNVPFENLDNTQNAKAVLDQLIVSLKYEYLRSVEENGEDSPVSQKIAASLKAAHEQRTGMIYIRPASAYLRTSYPSTTLQKDASLGWENMLAQHGRHQLPFASHFEKDEKLGTIQEIDKQFWQNINRVRVAASGRGNNVIAKDDIGNWYVKNYSANPEDIIRSAKNLAMFSMGAAMGGGLATLTTSITNTSIINNGKTILVTNKVTSKSILDLQYGRFTSGYTNELQDSYKELKTQVTRAKIKDSLVTAWSAKLTDQSEVAELTRIADSAVKELDPVAENPAPDQMGKEFLKGLKGLERVYVSLRTSIKSSALPDNSKIVAIDIGARTIKDVLDPLVSSRMQSIDKYQAALNVLNDSAQVSGTQKN